MPQLGESVAVSVFQQGPCSFCESKKQNPKFDELEIENDSAKLATKCSGMPNDTIDNPPADKSYYIWEGYWISANKSKVCQNAHHIVPGNASFAKCQALQKWFAGKVTVTKKYYLKPAVVNNSQASGKFVTTVNPGPPDQSVSYLLSPSSTGATTRVTRESTVEENLVTDKVDFDINDRRNGVWLPSNNAVKGWSAAKELDATDMDGADCSFGYAYSFNAMKETGHQFHDAHPDYSAEVIKELTAIDTKVQQSADACIAGCQGSQGKAQQKHPAPQRLASTVFQLATEIRPLLRIPPFNTPKPPWLTSSLSDRW